MQEKPYLVTVKLDPSVRDKLHYQQAKRVTDKKPKLSVAKLAAALITSALENLPE
jgi:hypothetical protein